MVLPKSEGGLGCKQMRVWNASIMAKHLWNIVSGSEDVWSDWARRTLPHGSSIWKMKAPQDCSYSWRKLLKIREKVCPLIQIQIGDGRQTSLFYDKWLDEGAIAQMLNNEEEVTVWGQDLKVNQWVNGNQWQIPDSFRRRYPAIVQKMERIEITQNADKAIWIPAKSGRFSVSSCYEALRYKKPRVPWNNFVWCNKIFPRHSFFLWMLAHGRIKTKAWLQQRRIVVDQVCALCSRGNEDIQHLFFNCQYSKAVWTEVLQTFDQNHRPLIWESEWRWIVKKTKGRARRKLKMKEAFATTVYSLWKERNCRVFRNSRTQTSVIVNSICNFVNARIES